MQARRRRRRESASLADVSACDLLLIPGGIGTRTLVENQQFLTLLRASASKDRLVATICTGSALLAKTGFERDFEVKKNFYYNPKD
jgi:putative intracellular protease/amidase